jgi:hypothetical protein
MDTKRDAKQEKMEARTNANNEKFEVLRGTLVVSLPSIREHIFISGDTKLTFNCQLKCS